MKASNPQPHLPLLAFFETVFLPLQLRNRCAAHAEQFRMALRWLAASIGHEPRVGDFNRNMMRTFVERLAIVGLATVTTKNIRKKIWQLWRYASELGYAEAPPTAVRRPKLPSYCRHPGGQAYVRVDGKKLYLGKHGTEVSRAKYLAKLSELVTNQPDTLPLPPDSGPPARAWLAEPPLEGSLLAFYRRTFRPELAPQLNSRQLADYDSAINQFHDHVGRTIDLADVTAELVEQFRAWLDIRPLSPKVRQRYRGCLRRIMRAAGFVDRFPKHDGIEAQSIVGAAEKAHIVLGRQGSKRQPPPVGEPGTLLYFCQHSYLQQAAPNCSEGHRQSLYTGFRHMRQCFSRDLLLQELSRDRIAELIAWLKEGGAELTTVKNNITRLLAVWRYAAELDEAPPVPRFRRWRIPRDAPDAWSLEELARILDAAGQLERRPIGGIPAGKYWRAILLVGYWTALRRGSLLKVRVQDLDLAKATLYVPGSQMKNGRGKLFHLGADAIAAIREIFDANRERLFPSPAEANTLGKHFRAIIAAAGVPKSRRPNGLFHKLRRTVITHTAARAGMAAAIALAGHSSQYVTERYLDPSFLPDHDATAWLPPIVDLAKKGGPTP